MIGATRVPLDCPEDCETLQEFERGALCSSDTDDDAGVDGGARINDWSRTEGCGRVVWGQWDGPPVYRIFDVESDMLIGWGQLSNVVETRAGCADDAFVAGQALSSCASVEAQQCHFQDQ